MSLSLWRKRKETSKKTQKQKTRDKTRTKRGNHQMRNKSPLRFIITAHKTKEEREKNSVKRSRKKISKTKTRS